MNRAKLHLQAQGRMATYTAPGGEAVSIRAKIQDSDSDVRMAGMIDMSAADVVAHVLETVDVEQGGIIEQAGNIYRIDAYMDGKTPGLTKLEMSRLSGDGQSFMDFKRALKLFKSKPVFFNSVQIVAHVNGQGVYWEDQGLGVPVETVRTVIAISEADVADMSVGSILNVGGEDFTVADVKRAGNGLVKVAI